MQPGGITHLHTDSTRLRFFQATTWDTRGQRALRQWQAYNSMSCQAGTAMTDQAGMLPLNDTSFLDALLSSADGSDVPLLNVDDNMFMSYLLALDDTAAGLCNATCSYAASGLATFIAWDEAHCKSLHA